MPEPHDDALIAQLRELGRQVDVPAAADQRAAVRARLQQPPPSGFLRRHLRRWLVAGAALGCAVAVVPPARAAVVDTVGGLLRIAGIEVRHQPGPVVLPPRPSPLPSTRSTTLQEARRLAAFPVRTPAALGEPERVTMADPDPSGAPRIVTMSYRGGAIQLDQFDGRLSGVFMKSAPAAEWTDVGGQSAIWLARPHPLAYLDRSGVEHTEAARLAGPSLIWAGPSVTYRLEGVATLAEARTIAATLG